mmetsp:Transcript_17919/g.40986  ORF Transcript_17919/g.40986 Transcript_17919/m.40986 type:complete len:80 (-) Transcript_17919:7-246(-)
MSISISTDAAAGISWLVDIRFSFASIVLQHCAFSYYGIDVILVRLMLLRGTVKESSKCKTKQLQDIYSNLPVSLYLSQF